MNVLVTAFKPFNNNINNYASEVIKYIQNVDKLIIDVVYDDCYEEIIKQKDLNNYDLIISLGEARSRKVLTLERFAHNISDCSLKDNKGQLKKNETIINNLPYELKTLVQIDKVKDLIEFSFDAGKFVCNNLYYHLLSNYPHKSLFIHVPECNNEISNYQLHAIVIEEIIKKLGDL